MRSRDMGVPKGLDPPPHAGRPPASFKEKKLVRISYDPKPSLTMFRLTHRAHAF